jgi:hypothetical protein
MCFAHLQWVPGVFVFTHQMVRTPVPGVLGRLGTPSVPRMWLEAAKAERCAGQ